MPLEMQEPLEILRIISDARRGITDRIAFFDGTNAMRIGGAWIAISPSPPNGNEATDFCKAIALQ